MLMEIRTFLVGLIGFFILMSCEKEPPRLPEETQQGKGTFGCLVNGELVIQEDQTGIFRPRKPYGIRNAEGQFMLIAEVEYGHKFEFFISYPELGHCVIDSVFFWVASKPHYYAARNVQQINFTKFDGIASGTFTFDADCYDERTHTLIPNQKIHVNKGRFDVLVETHWF